MRLNRARKSTYYGYLPAPPPGITRRRRFTSSLDRWRRRLKLAFGFAAIILLSGAGASLVATGVLGESGDDPFLRQLTLASYVIAAIICAANLRVVLRATVRNPTPIVLVGLAFTSMYWSDAPSVTFNRSVTLSGATFVGFFLATQFDRNTVVRIVGWALGATAIASLILLLILPDLGIQPRSDGDQWRGLFVHKNAMARVMALSIAVLALLAYGSAGLRRLPILAVLAVCGILLLKTGSATGIVVSVALLALIPGFIALSRFPRMTVPIGFAGVVLVLAAGNFATAKQDELLRALGRDPSLTGRTNLWVATADFVAERPALGFGYGAFWDDGSLTKMAIQHALQWNAPHSHNGFRDLTLDLGYFGLAIFGVGFLLSFLRALQALRHEIGAAALWPLVFLTFLVLYNLTESTLLGASVFWPLYVAVSCAPVARRARRRRQPGHPFATAPKRSG